jgi:hypothetical protein
LTGMGVLDGYRALGAYRFRVLGDGKSLYLSPPLRSGDPPSFLRLEVKGVRRLGLTFEHASGPAGPPAIGVWGHPLMVR